MASLPLRPVSFLSDFGHADEFVGVVHGVILRVHPGLRVVDVSHEVPRGDVRAGALMLLRAVQYLPPGVCMAVVDPGVGGERRAVAAETAWGHFVGPDNGLLAPAVAMVGGATRIVAIESEEFRLPRDGVTFDGRDVFAPAAAVLACGEATLGDLGPDVDPHSLTPLLLPLVDHRGEVVDGEVWWIDAFGNAQTNVSPDDLALVGVRPGDVVAVRIGGSRHELPWRDGYGDDEGTGMVHVDSYGMMAIAVAGGRADEVYGIRSGLSVGFSAVPGTGDVRLEPPRRSAQ
jgi:S-adenosyl-L-methionine hydrolase (adenosine-forming)